MSTQPELQKRVEELTALTRSQLRTMQKQLDDYCLNAAGLLDALSKSKPIEILVATEGLAVMLNPLRLTHNQVMLSICKLAAANLELQNIRSSPAQQE